MPPSPPPPPRRVAIARTRSNAPARPSIPCATCRPPRAPPPPRARATTSGKTRIFRALPCPMCPTDWASEACRWIPASGWAPPNGRGPTCPPRSSRGDGRMSTSARPSSRPCFHGARSTSAKRRRSTSINRRAGWTRANGLPSTASRIPREIRARSSVPSRDKDKSTSSTRMASCSAAPARSTCTPLSHPPCPSMTILSNRVY